MNTSHYYGDIIRRLFIAGAILMAVGLPFLYSSIPYPPIISIVLILVLGFFGGSISPERRSIIFSSVMVSGAAFLMFEYYAVSSYNARDFLFSTYNQLLAIIFFAAFYYGVKTARRFFVTSMRETDDFALDMLKARYAKGEISKAEFEEKRKELQ